MKSHFSLKRFFGIIAGGITGAFLLIGVGLFLILLISGYGPALPYFGIGHTIEGWKQTWTINGIYTAFAVVGVIGFLLGLTVSWRHSHLIQKLFGPTIAISIPIALVGWFIYVYANHVEIPQSLKLADCTNTLTIHLKVPKGRYYRLVLAVPSGSTNIFSGRIKISDGALMVTNFSVGSNETEEQCDFLHAQTNYGMEITFDRPPPPSTSVWLYWLQAYKDRDR